MYGKVYFYGMKIRGKVYFCGHILSTTESVLRLPLSWMIRQNPCSFLPVGVPGAGRCQPIWSNAHWFLEILIGDFAGNHWKSMRDSDKLHPN